MRSAPSGHQGSLRRPRAGAARPGLCLTFSILGIDANGSEFINIHSGPESANWPAEIPDPDPYLGWQGRRRARFRRNRQPARRRRTGTPVTPDDPADAMPGDLIDLLR